MSHWRSSQIKKQYRVRGGDNIDRFIYSLGEKGIEIKKARITTYYEAGYPLIIQTIIFEWFSRFQEATEILVQLYKTTWLQYSQWFDENRRPEPSFHEYQNCFSQKGEID